MSKEHDEKLMVDMLHCIVHHLALQNEILNKIMTAIENFAAAMATFNTQTDSAITGLQGDVANLQAQITALQNSPGTLTPADQASLDAIQAHAGIVADKLAALDALTPPVVPGAAKG